MFAGFFGSAMFIIFMINPLISQFLASFPNLSIADLGYLGTFASLGTVFFSLMIGRLGDRYSYLTSISILLLISASAFLVIALFSDFPLFCLGYFLIGASQSFLILISGIIGSKAPQHSIGKWTSVSQAMIYVAGFGAPTLGGILYEISPYLAFYSAIILLLLMASIGVYIIQKFTKL
jgi:MFS family permease